MSVAKAKLITALSAKIPSDILTNLLTEYEDIKRQFVLGHFKPSELQGGRFGECIVRLLEHLDTGQHTPFGTQIKNAETILNRASNNVALPNAIRLFVPYLTRVLMGVRNSRNVAHVGGGVDPNYADALLICQCADWILVELVRQFYNCPIDEARKIVANINEVNIPLVTEVDGFVRVQNTKLNASDSTLVVLYYKNPEKVADAAIAKWIKYGNITRFKSEILKKLDAEALIHYERGWCVILPKGILYVEKNIPLNLIL